MHDDGRVVEECDAERRLAYSTHAEYRDVNWVGFRFFEKVKEMLQRRSATKEDLRWWREQSTSAMTDSFIMSIDSANTY